MIAVFPISRCLVGQKIEICESLSIWPPGEWHGLPLIGELPPISSLASIATSASGISSEIFRASALVVCEDDSVKVDSIGHTHKGDLFALEKVAAACESRLDVARFEMCLLDLADTLFGRVGTWEGSNGASGCVFFDPENNRSSFVGGRYLVSTLTAGIGPDFHDYRPNYQHRRDEIGTVVIRILQIYRHALEAPDWTSKYVHCIRLFEVLADPFQLQRFNDWEKVRSNICSHLAKDKATYLQIAEQFKLLGNKGIGGDKGLRERVIHHGELLEQIYDSSEDLKKLFRQVERYVKKILLDLMQFDGQSWQQVIDWRKERLAGLGIA